MAKAKKTETDGEETPVIKKKTQKKKYVCARWPSLHLRGGIHFSMGYFETDDPKQQETVESNDMYARGIYLVTEKTPQRELTWEEQQEQSAIKELERDGRTRSRVTRGAVGTLSE